MHSARYHIISPSMIQHYIMLRKNSTHNLLCAETHGSQASIVSAANPTHRVTVAYNKCRLGGQQNPARLLQCAYPHRTRSGLYPQTESRSWIIRLFYQQMRRSFSTPFLPMFIIYPPFLGFSTQRKAVVRATFVDISIPLPL